MKEKYGKKKFSKEHPKQKELYIEIVHNNESPKSVLQKRKEEEDLKECVPKYANPFTKKFQMNSRKRLEEKQGKRGIL